MQNDAQRTIAEDGMEIVIGLGAGALSRDIGRYPFRPAEQAYRLIDQMPEPGPARSRQRLRTSGRRRS